jgi:hypothetical protein
MDSNEPEDVRVIEMEPFQLIDKLPDAEDYAEDADLKIEHSFSYKDEVGPAVIDAHFESKTHLGIPPDDKSKMDVSEIKSEPSEIKLEISDIKSNPDVADAQSHRSSSIDIEKNIPSRSSNSIDDQADDSIPRRLAKCILRNIEADAQGTVGCARASIGDDVPYDNMNFFVTQMVINWHIVILREMVDIMPVDINPREIIMYVCKTLEAPNVSSISGQRFISLCAYDQINTILTIARQFADMYWIDYDDAVYNECHRQLDAYAKFYVRRVYHPPSECCIFL